MLIMQDRIHQLRWVRRDDETESTITEIIGEHYSPNTAIKIVEWQWDVDQIFGIFRDGKEFFSFRFSRDNIAYQVVNPESEDESELEQQTTDRQDAKNCKVGLSCGGTCISKTKICRLSMTGGAQAAFDTLPKPETETEPVGDPTRPKVEPTLEGKAFNTDAIPDLTPSEFRKFYESKELLAGQDDPNAVHNKTFDQWKEDNPRGTRNQYQSQITSAIQSGFVPTDEAFRDSKLPQRRRAEAEQNQQNLDERRALSDRIQKALDFPLVDESTAANYRPRLTREEAEAYTQDSFFGSTDFFHGNSAPVTDSIVNQGSKPELNANGIYGQGTYLGISRDTGEAYAGSSAAGNPLTDSGLITANVRVRNPYVMDSKSFNDLAANFPGSQSNFVDSVAVREFVQAKGYDSMYIPDLGYISTFDGRQTVAVDYEQIPAGSQRIQQMTARVSEIDERASVANTYTGSRLRDRPPTESPQSLRAEADLLEAEDDL